MVEQMKNDNIDILTELQEIVRMRKEEREEGSYTVYLFDSGLDKVLKKLGEEAAETMIAAKNLEAIAKSGPGAAEAIAALKSGPGATEALAALKNEAGDLLYHLVVMLVMLGVDTSEVEAVLRERMNKKGNLKK